MLKEFLWNTFEKTGNIEAYVCIKEIENKTSHHKVDIDDNNMDDKIKP